jgi:hypothetical protein
MDIFEIWKGIRMAQLLFPEAPVELHAEPVTRSLTAYTPPAIHVLLATPVQANCCGGMSAWFVNRNGRTLCWTCDDERQMAQRRAA